MVELYTLGLTGILGVAFGVMFKRKPQRDGVKFMGTIASPKPSVREIELNKTRFNPKEVDFLQRLIQANQNGENVPTSVLIELLEVQFLSQTAKRIECNNFLKSLNMRILVEYGFKEAILTIGTDEDKRKKCYHLDSNFLQQLLEMFSNTAPNQSRRDNFIPHESISN
jgi:hypothetical protein